ncbi:hypothetical protein LV457_10435 [Mycobacterium sp. MYCO198283]|uniref:hypothetical protein n=1 Tax=Mycobacterium sp. MYCO198283 TaxID=2883505 RepID=UPI001E512518|nr:hypothetical protein [Mycobacterium sp. MYCO198283]MCG5432703.1 hypothetical protein [Mycobacterium sp. MYCO198283]
MAQAVVGAGVVASDVRPPDRVTVTAAHTARITASDPRAVVLVGRIRAQFDPAVAAVTAFWGADWPREVAIEIAADDAAFAASAGGPVSRWTGVAAVTLADRVDPVGRVATARRILFAPGAAAMSDTALRTVLRHELFHYAARADTAADAPQWLTEGVADFVARADEARDDEPTGDTAPTLPSDAELAGPGRSAAYDRAWRFACFVADRYGPPALRALYVHMAGPARQPLDAAARDVLHTDAAGLQRQWALAGAST